MVNLVNQRASQRNILQGKKMSKNDKVLEKGDRIYVSGKI